MAWTESRVATVEKLWADGLSAAEIAKQLGGTTRNAVIGVVHRNGWQRRGQQYGVPVESIPPRAPTPTKQIAPLHNVAAQPLRIKRSEKKPKAAKKPEKPAPKFEDSQAGRAAMALLGQSYSAEKRREMYWGTR